MKKLNIILIFALSLLFIFSCEDDKDIAVLKTSDEVAPSVTSPLNGLQYQLTSENGSSDFETIKWTAADYGVKLAVEYTLQLAKGGTNFESPIAFATVDSLSFNIKNGELNLLMNDLGLIANETSNVDLRVLATVNNSAVDTLYSNVIGFSVTPYGYNKPNIITPVAGNYSLEKDTAFIIPFETFSWEKVNYGENFISSYVLEFDTVGNNFANAVELYSGNNTQYTPTMGELNNLMLRRGFEAGTLVSVEFRVTSNTSGRGIMESDIQAYNIKMFIAELKVDPLYLVGSATLAGWDNSKGIEIVWDKDNKVYSVITDLIAGGMKILKTSGQWAPQWGDDGTKTGKLSYRPDEATTDPPEIPSPGTGTYKLTVDLENLTYKFEAQ